MVDLQKSEHYYVLRVPDCCKCVTDVGTLRSVHDIGQHYGEPALKQQRIYAHPVSSRILSSYIQVYLKPRWPTIQLRR